MTWDTSTSQSLPCRVSQRASYLLENHRTFICRWQVLTQRHISLAASQRLLPKAKLASLIDIFQPFWNRRHSELANFPRASLARFSKRPKGSLSMRTLFVTEFETCLSRADKRPGALEKALIFAEGPACGGGGRRVGWCRFSLQVGKSL
jgi:hypothetical protein